MVVAAIGLGDRVQLASKFFNPKPMSGDLVLPMPCGGYGISPGQHQGESLARRAAYCGNPELDNGFAGLVVMLRSQVLSIRET